MKALVYNDIKKLGYCDVQKAKPRKGEHLIRVIASGICGSDMHAYLGHDTRRPAPLILGHEAAGIIEGGLDDGRRVTINPLVNCRTCAACTTGREKFMPEPPNYIDATTRGCIRAIRCDAKQQPSNCS